MNQTKKTDREMPPAVILCGGYGTRLREVTEQLPKPMVPIGPQPILWHIMKTYASFGVKRFILCLGYKREIFIDYFLHYHAHVGDVTIKLGKGEHIAYHNFHQEEDWEVTLADTGLDDQTGSRIYKASKYLNENENFFLTYGDAVADINIADLYEYHLKHKKSITITAVRPPGRFGEISIGPDNIVQGFAEKPQTSNGYVNGGFMVVNKKIINTYLSSEDQPFECIPIQSAAQNQDLTAFCHNGYWQCMDTAREYQLLIKLWNSGEAPWKKYWP
jgi:glucose-1-phosphate cytidylyltransferase